MAGTMKTVLAIAATDSCGGAGLAADIRAIHANGAHGAVAVTAVTSQSTHAVESVYALPASVIRDQLRAVLGDIAIAAVKSGVIGSPEAARIIAEILAPLRLPYVLDPVAAATSGGMLNAPGTTEAIVARLFPLATLITPNAIEAAALTGFEVLARGDAARAGRALLESGCGAVLVKGGHLAEDEAVDVLVTREGFQVFASIRFDNPNTHGTGCTLASAIAANLANRRELADAVRLGREFVAGAIRGGYSVATSPGPVDQLWPFRAGAIPFHPSLLESRS
jgi:hydroxymethylpyrimidine kinase/phosphomethylpyrimidine kinase